MMKNLKVWQKLVLMGIAFVLPFVIVTYKLIASVDELQGAVVRQEISGLEYYVPLRALLKDLQQHRGMMNAWLGGDASFERKVADKRADIENDIKTIDQMDRRLNATLQTSARWQALRMRCKELLSEVRGVSADRSFDLHTQVVNDTIALITYVGDTSTLTVDSKLDSYYLMSVVILHGPELGEFLAQARGLGARIAASGKMSSEQFAQLTRLTGITTYLQQKVAEAMDKAAASNVGLKLSLAADKETSTRAVQEADALIRALTESHGTGMNATDYFAGLTRSIESISETQDHLIAALKQVLNKRVEAFQREVIYTLVWASLGLLLASGVGFLIMRDIARPLEQVVGTANQIATGNFAAHVGFQTRKDEIGILARAFDRMTAELTALIDQVQRSVIQVNSSVTEIVATANEQQATAAEIAATTTEVGATSKEISATSKELVNTMHEVSTVAEQTAGLAGGGQMGLARMEETMGRVTEAAGSINAKLAVLNEKAGNINQVVTTIAKVADQTNLLSLNAAIEAEKAGEHGRGFSVVATEIRRLADQTAVATHDIEQMVKEIQSAVAAGVMGMDKFSEEVRRGLQEVQQVGGQLSQIIHQIQALAPRFTSVSEGMEAQATGAEQISDALAQLTEASQQTVQSLRQSNEAIGGLNQVTHELHSVVSRFKLQA